MKLHIKRVFNVGASDGCGGVSVRRERRRGERRQQREGEAGREEERRGDDREERVDKTHFSSI